MTVDVESLEHYFLVRMQCDAINAELWRLTEELVLAHNTEQDYEVSRLIKEIETLVSKDY